MTPGDLTGLGRRHALDARDLAHPITKKATSLTSRTWSCPKALDQGNTSQCVAYAGTQYLSASPIRNKPSLTPEQLYIEARKVDEWPGENYDGTSVRGLMKVLHTLGYVSEYRWATDAATVVSHILTTGPVVVGTNWWMDMFTPDRWGYIWPLGTNAGGHAWAIMGANRTRRNPDGTNGAVRMINSWGSGWGQLGRAWVSFDVLDDLIKDDGEACAAIETLVK